MQAGADDEFGAGLDGGLGILSPWSRCRSRAASLGRIGFECAQHAARVGTGHGDFDHGDAACDHGIDDGKRLLVVFGAKNGDKPDAFDDLCGRFPAFYFVRRCPA